MSAWGSLVGEADTLRARLAEVEAERDRWQDKYHAYVGGHEQDCRDYDLARQRAEARADQAVRALVAYAVGAGDPPPLTPEEAAFIDEMVAKHGAGAHRAKGSPAATSSPPTCTEPGCDDHTAEGTGQWCLFHLRYPGASESDGGSPGSTEPKPEPLDADARAALVSAGYLSGSTDR